MIASANPTTYGQSLTFTATVSASVGTPTGTVTFLDGSTVLGSGTLNASGQATFTTTVLAVGGHNITATYSGDANYSASSGNLNETINQSGSTTSLIASANPTTYGQSLTFTATVSASVGTPTGTVTFLDGSVVLGTGTLNAAGQVTFTTTALALGAGSDTIIAAYSGDANYSNSSGTVNETVNQSSSTTAVFASANPTTYGQSLTFTVTVSASVGTPTGTVTFLDGSVVLGSGTLNAAGQATFTTTVLAVGGHTITATYSGDANFGTSSGNFNEAVNQSSSTTSLIASANPTTYGQSLTFTATVSASIGTPTGTVTFQDGGVVLGSRTLNAAGQATFTTTVLAVGGHTITRHV